MWEQSRIDSDLQLTLYSLGCQNILNAEPAVLSYYFLAHNKVVTTARTQIQKDEALAEMEAVAQKIEKKDFTPDTSKCPRCDFKQSCRYSAAKAQSQPQSGNGRH